MGARVVRHQSEGRHEVGLTDKELQMSKKNNETRRPGCNCGATCTCGSGCTCARS
jgi:hypothetical protein